MVEAVVQDPTKTDRRITCEYTLRPRFRDTFLKGGNKVYRKVSAEDFIHEFKVAAARHRLHPDFAITVLAVTAALFLMLALNVRLALDRFTVGYFGRMQKHFHAVALLQPRDRHFHVHLALARHEELLGLGFARVAQPEVFIHELVDRCADLFFVPS